MRGWFTLLTGRYNPDTYHTGVFVASAEPEVISAILPLMRDHFPKASFTYVASRAYAEQLSWVAEAFNGTEVFWIESLKATPIRALSSLRKRRFDVCIAVWQGHPTFLITKAAAFWLNARKFVIYDENGNAVPLDRTNWRYLLARLWLELRKSSAILFYPFGFTYLLARTFYLYTRSKLARSRSNVGTTGL